MSEGKEYTCADAIVDIEFLTRSNSKGVMGLRLSDEGRERQEQLMGHIARLAVVATAVPKCVACFDAFKEKGGEIDLSVLDIAERREKERERLAKPSL